MNGAESLVRTLLASGVDTCFANPGTSEINFVAALDRAPGMRCVLALFEGVVTGAADGYGRMARKPAATLMHCGPGFANGLAYLHKNEKVIPASMSGKGDGLGSSGVTVVVNHSVSAVDAASFQGHIRRHGNMIANEVTRALKRKGVR